MKRSVAKTLDLSTTIQELYKELNSLIAAIRALEDLTYGKPSTKLQRDIDGKAAPKRRRPKKS